MLREWFIKWIGGVPPSAVSIPSTDQLPVEHAIIAYRSNKNDGMFEGSEFLTKDASSLWVDVVLKFKKGIEMDHTCRFSIIITYFAKL